MVGEDWTFDSEGTPQQTLSFAVDVNAPKWVIMMPNDRPHTFTLINQGQEVGTLDFSTGVLKFNGNVDESAALLFLMLKEKVDKYIEDHFLE